MTYKCTPPAAEFYTVMSCGILYIFICTVTLLVLLKKKANLFRLACVLTVIGELATNLTAITACTMPPRTINEKYISRAVVLIMKWIPAVLFDVALLKLGRSYRPEGLRNTRLFITTVMVTIISSLLMIPFTIIYKKTLESNAFIGTFTVLQYVLTTTRYLAFLLSIVYAFFPMFAIHGVGNSQAPYYSIDARTAAFGTYYMIIALLWFMFIVLFDIITSVQHATDYVHVAFFISAVMNCSAPLAFGLQAPHCFVEKMRRSILGHTINRVVIVERGVLSTGILQGNVYESPL